ncbi:MAG: decarboxylating NADP(+)-dependent phosphogluconate dehydrogenase [Planctomycetales bacterium]|nr:decarboxylating NADP(+)-dependent phosphogluconate dehydrogenase [Planctomycetales bacterium]NIN76675.1 decarboxylating NADP(+)-dependent phosphogluconate dehydrogenase [Planctomycetales bacterium]NIO33863.1 decarboxylating NADP(+)-dependent phosphogluconate dehydrogenase [Planctomycetales bacterium]NIO45670.1 decarboxylating NADP(+)-dependent phosphogluconate dehydrogenase [Planctomycetales bacterium]NIP68294.1 decarboxylating NADP(+)-dependent phosphogluconate dehydrogenase [Planctomycetal
MSATCDIGLMGLAVMGRNLVLNMADHGFRVAVYNRTTSKVDDFVGSDEARGKPIVATHSLQQLVEQLRPPRRVMLMIQSGEAVPALEERLYPQASAIDGVVQQLLELLAPGDVIIDGGNTHFQDTERRTRFVERQGLWYVGTGVSGGEEGARFGPSLMPGGSPAAWPQVQEIFQAIAAKVGPADDVPCCQWVGARGAGHYVKMVHNGIEYGDMQLICEAYLMLREAAGLTNPQLYDVFDDWNRGQLQSYLIEISRDIFSVKDELSADEYLVDKILDTAGAKGTGKWMSQLALDLGVPSTLVTAAVYARSISAMKDQRLRASRLLPGPDARPAVAKREVLVEQIRQALYASKICSYAQGFVQLKEAAEQYDWSLNLGDVALLWRGGCIIRAQFLDRIKEAFDEDPQLENLLLHPYFQEAVREGQDAWRQVVATASQLGLPVPAFSNALAYYDSYRRERLPANLLQAQRDYFGAHTYRRTDREGVFHTDWSSRRRQPE